MTEEPAVGIPMTLLNYDTIVVLDFGSQYTQLIARRMRELGVYTEILPHSIPLQELQLRKPKGVVISGGPMSVYESDSLNLPADFLEWQESDSIPILGICYGMQLLAHVLGGKVLAVTNREYGLQTISVLEGSRLLGAARKKLQVWMSHGDQVQAPPQGSRVIAKTSTCPVAAFENTDRGIFGVQFHPEVHHTEGGTDIIRAFLFDICRCRATWQIANFIDQTVAELKSTLGNERVLMGVSGGVDSTVAALLLQNAIGEQLHCVFVDNGLLRTGEVEEVRANLAPLFTNFHFVDATKIFLQRLQDIVDPEEKRTIIATAFIEVFQQKASELSRSVGGFTYLGQGTIAPDRIESGVTSSASSHIKSHHNVALPETLHLKVVEPLQLLYKDEVRRVGEELGLPSSFVNRQPFPGPAMAVRIIAPVTVDRLRIVREADVILTDELKRAGVYEDLWQAFAVFLPVQSVGVMGDARTFEYAVALRIVESEDAMTARIAHLDWDLLERTATRIINEVHGVNRVLYDLSNKPPATIEFL
jgi:GMP synthase (glutamine-hydrolysing)